MLEYKDISSYLSAHENFLLVPHEDPDGDTLGAALGLAIAFKKAGKNSRIFLPKPLSFGLQFLQGPLDAMGGGFVWSEMPRDLSRIEQVIYFDCADTQLVQKSSHLIGDGRFSSINIDHHVDNKRYADINFVDPTCASTTQVVYNIINTMKIELDKDILLPLYTGLVTDTGSFAYSNTTEAVFEMAATCLKYGVKPYDVYRYVYEEKPYEVVALLGEMLTKIHIEPNKKVAWVYVTQEILDRYSGTSSYTEGVVNHLRSIRGIEVAIVIRQSNTVLRVSLRSKSDIKVNQIAAQFNGGGHEKASGCKIDLNNTNPQRAIEYFIGYVNDFVEKSLAGGK